MSHNASPKQTLIITESHDQDASDKLSPGRYNLSPMSRAKSTGEGQASKPLFMTGANFYGKKTHDDRPAKMDEVVSHHDKLNHYIEQLDEKVKNRLQDNQSSFLMAYREQMTIIQKELALLKKKVDEETYRRKNDERMNIIEQERNWFRAEAIRLDQVCKEQQKLITELKFKLKIITEDKSYFEDFVLQAKKENKMLKEELMQLEQGRKEEEGIMTLQSPSNGKITTGSLRRGQLMGSSKRGLLSRKNLGQEETENDQPNLREMTGNYQSTSVNEEKLSEIIQQLKVDLDKEKKLTRQLRNEKSQMVMNKIELEQILVEAINEVKKDISRRRNTKSYKDFDKGPMVPQNIDITKFSVTDKRNLVDYFMSNEIVLEELYNLVFNNQHVGQRINTVPDQGGNLHSSNSTRAEAKMKYSFNYGFGNPSNLRLGAKDISNLSTSQKTQSLIGELKRVDGRKKEL